MSPPPSYSCPAADRIIALPQVCPEVDICLDVRPPESDDSLKPDHVNPFSLRHAMQQASIVGNMQRFGLLEVIDSRLG